MRFRGGRHRKESDRESSVETPVWVSEVGILHFKGFVHAALVCCGSGDVIRTRTSKYECLKSNKHRKSVLVCSV